MKNISKENPIKNEYHFVSFLVNTLINKIDELEMIKNV